MKDYFYFYKGWHKKTTNKGRKGGFAFQRILKLSIKSTMLPTKEGFIFIDLMFRRYNRTHKRQYISYEYGRGKHEEQ